MLWGVQGAVCCMGYQFLGESTPSPSQEVIFRPDSWGCDVCPILLVTLNREDPYFFVGTNTTEKPIKKTIIAPRAIVVITISSTGILKITGLLDLRWDLLQNIQNCRGTHP